MSHTREIGIFVLNVQTTNEMASRDFTGTEIEGESRCNHGLIESSNGNVQKTDQQLPKATNNGTLLYFLIYSCKYTRAKSVDISR